MQIFMIYVTYPALEKAREVSRILVEERLVACANIFPAHESLYHWDGAMQSENEVAVIYKTAQTRFEPLKARILALHPFECPCIAAMPIENAHDDFVRWIVSETMT